MAEIINADDDDVEMLILASSTILFSSCAILLKQVPKRKKYRSVWVRGHLQSRHKYGAYNCLDSIFPPHASLLPNLI